MSGLPTRFPRPLTAGQLWSVPLRALARPAPIGGRAVRVDPDRVVHHPGRALAGGWPSAGDVVRCPIPGCGSPVRVLTAGEAVAALLRDLDPEPVVHGCLWHGPRGVARQHPAGGPVPVCMEPPVRRWP